MAQLTVYAPDELVGKARQHKGRIVFSRIFSNALREAVADVEAQDMASEDTLEATVERFRKQKKEVETPAYKEGLKDGWAWARDEADYSEAVYFLLATTPGFSLTADESDWLKDFFEEEEHDIPFGLEVERSAYIAGYRDGIDRLYREVESRL